MEDWKTLKHYLVNTLFYKYRIEAMNIMTYKGYQGKFEYDQDADIFHGDLLMN